MSQTATVKTSGQCNCGSNQACQCNKCGPHGGAGFSRPNFFAGQLLTDEDLRDAMSYVVEKNRLHNRHFMGEGVVCGLQVSPHPCTDRREKVIVRKGHAINGCGDDILVTKNHELDIVAMARDLIARERGYDCGDPCLDQQSETGILKRLQKELQHLRRELGLVTNLKQGKEKEEQVRKKEDEISRQVLIATPVKYGLFVKYHEQAAGFVSPYQTGDCEQNGCHGSRVTEGYEFEIRCATPSLYADLRSELEACSGVIPDFELMQGRTLHGISAIELVRKILVQYDEIEVQTKTPQLLAIPLREFTDTELASLKAAPYLPTSLRSSSAAELRALTLTALRSRLAETLLEWVTDRIGGDIPDVEKPFNTLSDGQIGELKSISFLPESLTGDSVDIKAVTSDQLIVLLPNGFSFRNECLTAISIEAGKVNVSDLLAAVTDAIAAVETAFSDTSIPTTTSSKAPISIATQREAVRTAFHLLTLAVRLHLFVSSTSAVAEFNKSKRAFSEVNDKLKLLKHVEERRTGMDRIVPDSLVDLLEIRITSLVNTPDDGDIQSTFDTRATVVGEILHSGLMQQVFRNLDDINEKLLGFLASGEISLSSELRNEMFGVNLSLFDADKHLLMTEAYGEILRQAQVVSRAVAEVARSCMCHALLPPCPIDSDRSVLLADITVSNCQVTEICNLSRRMVITGPSLRYWFSDFKGILKQLRESCCPSSGAINKIAGNERGRLERQEVSWRNGATVNFVPNLLNKPKADATDYLDHIGQWNDLHAETIDPIQQIAVMPTQPAADLVALLGAKGVDQKELNRVLAQLAGRPEADLRNLLSWSEQFGSPAEVRSIALAAETIAKSISNVAVSAQGTAENAKLAAEAADAKAGTADGKAETANTTAKAASSAAETAHAAAEAAAKTAETADDKAGKAQTAAKEAGEAATEANTAASNADKKAEDAKALVEKAQFDHDNDSGTADRTILEVVQLIRDKLDAGEFNTIAQIKASLTDIVGENP